MRRLSAIFVMLLAVEATRAAAPADRADCRTCHGDAILKAGALGSQDAANGRSDDHGPGKIVLDMLKGQEPGDDPFDHAETGWPLAPYHQRLDCRDCHQQAPFKQLDSKCSSCHPVPAAGTASAPDSRPQAGRHAHEAWYNYIQKEAAADLCVICHQGVGRGDSGRTHPMAAMKRKLPPALLAAGAKVNADAKMNCLTCHSTATSRFAPIRLPDAGPDGLCLACHPRQAKVFGTVHDIHSESSRGGSSGTCRTCHPAHKAPRRAVPTEGDPSGQCTACHLPRSRGQSKSAIAFAHPETACGDCHNPHESRFGQFLSRPAAELCAKCHPGEAGLAGGPHDSSLKPDAWPDKAAAARGPCLACHVPHGEAAKEDLLRFAASRTDSSPDGTCLACHPDAAWNSNSSIALLHPREISADRQKVDLKLLPADAAGKRRMSCRTCHDVHGGAKPAYLTRGALEEPAGLCLQCHTGKKYIELTGHSPRKLEQLGFDAGLCRPCHAMHARREESWGQMLSPRFLLPGGKREGSAAVKPNGDAVPCLACHRSDGPAPVPAVASHPNVLVPNVVAPGAPGYLPLYDSAGHVRWDGQIACRTCHLSHGRLDLLQLAAENRPMAEQDRKAMRLNLRTFASPNICTECHKQDARLKFLMFHNTVQREQLAPK